MQIDTATPVMVTGATGYVAGHLVRRLLEMGMTVHAPVRDPSKAEKLRYLDAIAAETPGTIRYFKADLLDQGSYAEAMAGCGVVFHTASPFTLHVRDAQRDLVDPAVKGTENVLNTASANPSVTRVVVTSSVVAIFGDNADLADAPNGVLTEEMWNSSSSLEHQPYAYSKTQAERAAWKLAAAQDQWDLVTINPSLVIGPGINPDATSESFAIVRQFGNGKMWPGAPRLGLGVVDVRDLAEAHVKAGFTPDAKGRYIISAKDTDLLALGRMLAEKYGDDWPLPRFALPKAVVWLLGPLLDKSLSRRMIARNMGHPFKSDNSKGVRELGVSYRPVKQSMEQMFAQLIASGRLKKR